MGRKKVRKSYPLEFKKKAVAMSQKEGITVGEVADELGISPQYLSKWRSDLMGDGELENAEKRLDALDENRRLREEVKQLKVENEILKNAPQARCAFL